MIKAAVSNPLSTVQRRYQREFDKNVRWDPKIKEEAYEFVDRPQLAALRQVLSMRWRIADTINFYFERLDSTEY